ncbi:hypothetical protein ACFL59_01225 [Planctomycetota bacterium]
MTLRGDNEIMAQFSCIFAAACLVSIASVGCAGQDQELAPASAARNTDTATTGTDYTGATRYVGSRPQHLNLLARFYFDDARSLLHHMDYEGALLKLERAHWLSPESAVIGAAYEQCRAILGVDDAPKAREYRLATRCFWSTPAAKALELRQSLMRAEALLERRSSPVAQVLIEAVQSDLSFYPLPLPEQLQLWADELSSRVERESAGLQRP